MLCVFIAIPNTLIPERIMQKTLVGGLVVALLAIGGLWYGIAHRGGEVEPPAPTTVKVGYLPIISALPLYVAEEQRLFADAGIAVEKIPFQTSEQVLDALIRGDIDVVPALSIVPVLRVERINPGHVKAFSITDITLERPFDALLVKNEAEIASLDQLSGKKVGVFPGGTARSILHNFLTSQGIDTATVEIVELPPTAHLQALSSGSIDALYAYEPTVAIALETGSYRKIHGSVYASMLNHTPIGFALLRSSLIEEQPELAQKVVEIFDQANGFIQTHDAETREILAASFHLTPEVAAIAVPLFMSPSRSIDKNVVAAFISLLASIGEVQEMGDISALFYQP